MNIKLIKAFKEYNETKVLDIDELQFEENNIYVILGSNGSGKSTLINIISGLNKLSGGKILYDDKILNNEIRKEISIMVQKPYLFNTTSKENILKGLKFRNFNELEINNAFEKYKSYFNIDNLLNKKSKWLSGGERAKIALLRTAVLETELTILDEPTASMDIESSMIAEKLILDMKHKKKTIIIVTHDVNQAMRVADCVIFMDKGKIIEMGNKNKVLKNPENRLVKQILNI
ncbi:MAG: putative tungstate transporter, ATP-binding protein TupC [Bacillota bacterium]|jgi:tungstate transport system ATP-binding protein|nr:putative tungstate transporter, ATP-binding protein TupC [Bacillota bacterium]